jgi:hypothetical protein
VWPLQLLARKLLRHQKEKPTDQTWLFGSG